ncbi:MAG: proprotein convertase P-domain-containing protein, partial [Acidimicrobiales bacterium]|nr:proprotein convertase P-domain-containing protein [Acidimicrobiales bacterium]
FTEAPRSVNVPTDIPRASNQGTDSILDIDYNGVITALTVNVDITHPDTNQLELLLIAPDGRSFILHDSREGSDGGANLSTTYPEPTASITALDALIGSAAAGRWILRAIDRDLGNENADRIINSWGLNITRRADNAWRLPTNLVVDGAVDAQTLCRIQPLVQNGVPVPGAITLTCGDQDPVRLTTFQCGNGVIDPAETCDDGNFDAGDGCDARCLTECGNGRQDEGEECEDGNVVDTDACTSSCTNARCGDGLVWFGNEDCDQGAEGNSDEPNAVCRTDCTPQRCGDG